MKRFLSSLPFRLGAGAVLCLAAAYYIARCMAAAAGYKHGLPYAALVGLLMPALLWSAASPRLFWRAALPAVAVMGALHPVTRLYGHITEDYVLALLATDAGEASEFAGILVQVGWKTLAFMLLALGILRALERWMLRGAGREGALERFS
ncbi:MAG: hypothetical protein HUK26_02125, partial [Duodenibacillus sp.]|nr:hypothetical protein [Duodenibacillus sp.]